MKTNQGRFMHFTLACILALAPTLGRVAIADDAPEVEKVETEEAKSPTAPEKWASEVQTKYSLTDEQMKKMSDAGIKGPHLAFTAELAKQSGKSVEEIAAMRTTEKMGWGAIAKKLGVHPGALGQSVSSLRHDIKENRGQAKKEEKQAMREERKAEREVRKSERKEAREARKAERQEAKAHKSH
jgi:hypothetical protein